MCTEQLRVASCELRVSGFARHSRAWISNSKLSTFNFQLGFSLVEVILFILVVSVALVVLVQAFALANVGSADPVLRRQSLAIAQAMLEEISFKAFANPSGGYSCPPNPCNASTRSQFDDVMDYNGFTMNGLSSLDNLALAGLEHYRVNVAVAAAAIGSVPAAAGWRITVTVTDPANNQLSLDGYRANY